MRLAVESLARGPRSRAEREERVARRGGSRGAWAKLGRCGWKKEKGEQAGLLGRGEKEKKREAGLGRAGLGLGWKLGWVR